MASASKERLLLDGLLAQQMGWVSRQQVLESLRQWSESAPQPLGNLLGRGGLLTPAQRTLLDKLTREHLKKHGDDAARSLAELGEACGLVAELREVLSKVAPTAATYETRGPSDPYATKVGPTPGTAASGAVGPAPAIPLPPSPATDKSAADPYATRATSPTAPMADGGSTAPYATVAGPARTPQALVQAIGASTSSGLRFRILRPFAKGGLGEVLIAEDQELHREVALKQIQERYADDVESRNRFIAEAEITGALEHPGVVPVYGLGTYADGRPFYAMRFIRGDTFGDAIARFHKADVPGRDPGEREVALRQLLERFKDVCQAIAYAHSRGIIHRDLKPGNIMLGKYGETLVVDWGLAKPINQVETVKPPTGEHRIATTLTGTATVMGVAVGTPQFMSPEQAWGQLDRVGPPSDIYSLGATLYTLLVGVSPFEDRDINVVLDKVKKGDFPKPRSIKPAVHPALEAICLKAMALRPEDRYKTPLELVEDIDHWLADEPVSAWREPWRLRAARWLRRNKTKTTVAAAVILVATVSLGITNILLTAANERERQAKLKAEMNFRLAKSAVDDFHTKVSEEDLLLEPGMEALRQRLLGGASEFYAKFVEDRADDTTLQAELARAKFRLGLITGEIESEKTAIAKLEEARQIFEKEEDTYHTDLVRCYFQLGRLYRATDDLAESERMYQRAIARLKAKPSLSDEELAELGRSLNGLGNVYQKTRRAKEAEAQYREALVIWSKLAEKSPQATEPRRYEGVALHNLGILSAASGRRDEALELFGRAAVLRRELVDKQPNLSKYRDDLASTSFYLGEVHLAAATRKVGASKLEDALGAYQSASDIWRELAGKHPSVLSFQSHLAEAYEAQALVHRAARDFREAIKAHENAHEVRRKLAARPDAALNYLRDLAYGHYEFATTLAASGQFPRAETEYRKALAVQEQLVKQKGDVPLYQSDLAATLEGFGRLHLAQEKDEEAHQLLTRALAVWLTLYRQRPEIEQYLRGLRSTCKSLRDLTRRPGGYRIAIERLDEVIDTCADDAKAKPDKTLRLMIIEAYWARAEAQMTAGNLTQALANFDEAKQLAPDNALLILGRAAVLARQGDLDKTAADLDELSAPTVQKAEWLYGAARAFGWAAAAAVKKDVERADKLATRAEALLERARQLGYFRSTEARQRLNRDPEWQTLRDRPTFRDLRRRIDEQQSEETRRDPRAKETSLNFDLAAGPFLPKSLRSTDWTISACR